MAIMTPLRLTQQRQEIVRRLDRLPRCERPHCGGVLVRSEDEQEAGCLLCGRSPVGRVFEQPVAGADRRRRGKRRR